MVIVEDLDEDVGVVGEGGEGVVEGVAGENQRTRRYNFYICFVAMC